MYCLIVTQYGADSWPEVGYRTVLSWAMVMHWLLDQRSLQWNCGLMSLVRVQWVAQCLSPT